MRVKKIKEENLVTQIKNNKKDFPASFHNMSFKKRVIEGKGGITERVINSIAYQSDFVFVDNFYKPYSLIINPIKKSVKPG